MGRAPGTISLNINGGLTEYLVKGITFNSGTYTISGAQNLTFGDATTSLNNELNEQQPESSHP